MKDESLAASAAAGDQEAFAALVERYRSYIYTLAYKITLYPEDALDVTQIVFERLTRKIGQFDRGGSFRAWLATLVTRIAIDYQRRPSRRETPVEPETLTLLPNPTDASIGTNPREQLEHIERLQQVEEAMKELPPQARAIFTLRWSENMKPQEIAHQLALPAGQVRSQLCRAISRLRQILAEKTN